jgi:ABC-2 type transport system permease protein
MRNQSMRNQVVSELRKLRTTRSVWGLLGALLAVVALGTWGALWAVPNASLAVSLAYQRFLNVPMSLVSIFVMILGLRSFTDEFRHGSIVPTLLASPDRRRVLAAKVVALASVAAMYTVAAAGFSFAIGVPWLVAKGVPIHASVGPLALWFGKLLLTDLLASAIGVGVGLAVRHQVAAIVGTLVWITLAENLVGGFAPNVAKFLPASAGEAIGSVGQNILGPTTGALVFATWTVIAVVVGSMLMQRRDIG